jgi:hypothetical protein
MKKLSDFLQPFFKATRLYHRLLARRTIKLVDKSLQFGKKALNSRDF